MSNPYSPPKASVDRPKNLIYSDEYKRGKSAIRPFGIVLVVVLYFAFSAASAILLMMEGGSWWVFDVVISGLLAYWFRKLWWGDEKERKIAVYFGFFIAALSWFVSPKGALQSWPVSDLIGAAEGCYFFLAACYLICVRKRPFFEAAPAH